MAVETFCVICTIMKRHPELRLGKQEELDIGKLIDNAVQLYWRYIFDLIKIFNVYEVKHLYLGLWV